VLNPVRSPRELPIRAHAGVRWRRPRFFDSNLHPAGTGSGISVDDAERKFVLDGGAIASSCDLIARKSVGFFKPAENKRNGITFFPIVQ
jgi:hypothetical protein